MGKKEDKIESTAEAAYGVVRYVSQILGDDSYEVWVDSPEWMRQNCFEQVRDIMGGSTLTSEQQHTLWRGRQEAEGWTWGPGIDPEKKEHPCVLPYADLPSEARAKDITFRATVRGILGL